MKTDAAELGQWAKCVECIKLPKNAVPIPFKHKASRDDHPFVIQPKHHPTERLIVHSHPPKFGTTGGAAPFRKTRFQKECKLIVALLQRSPPAANRCA